MPLHTPASVRSLLAEHGLRPSRALGQNFLVDPNTARRITRLAGVEPGDRVLEIGPGLGSLTLALLERGCRILALEFDQRVAAALEQVVHDHEEVSVVRGNALDVDLASLLDGGDWRSVSNLPYNVATPVVVRMLEEVSAIRQFLVMVQRELAERWAAGPGSPAYGAVSVRIAYHSRAKIVGVVPPSVFIPVPKVESALVELVRRDAPPVEVPSVDRMFTLVRAGFAHRRKMLRQSLRPVLGQRTLEVLAAASIEPQARAESLGLEAWAAMARAEVAT